MFLFDTESHEFRECVCSCLLTRCKLSCTWFQQAVIFVYVMLWSVVHLFSHITFPSYLLVYNTFWDSFLSFSVCVRECVCGVSGCVSVCAHACERVSNIMSKACHLWSLDQGQGQTFVNIYGHLKVLDLKIRIQKIQTLIKSYWQG